MNVIGEKAFKEQEQKKQEGDNLFQIWWDREHK